MVDTVAQVTVVSSEVAENIDLKLSSEVGKFIGAEQGSYFPAKIARNVPLRKVFFLIKWYFYVAALEQPVIFGLDSLMVLNAVINFDGNSGLVGMLYDPVPISMKYGLNTKISRVTLRNRTVALCELRFC